MTIVIGALTNTLVMARKVENAHCETVEAPCD
jgi:hypothetical protein